MSTSASQKCSEEMKRFAPVVLPPRILSVDALRGFDMFWIMQGKEVVLTILGLILGRIPPILQYHFSHPEWEGFSGWDLIMPLFLFITGVTIPFSVEKYTSGHAKYPFYRRLFRRVVLLWILGMIAQGHLLSFDLNKIHFFSNTLQAIAVGYFVSSIVLVYLPIRFQPLLTLGLLILYWVWMMFIPLPTGEGSGILLPERNWAMYIDELILGRFRDGTHYTWILSGLGFSATVMLGTHAGYIIKFVHKRNLVVLYLTLAGVICLLFGWLWSFHFPIIKHIWSSSMALWAGGWSYLLLAIFFLLIDVFGFTVWAFPFIVVGSNAILAYIGAPFLKEVLDFALVKVGLGTATQLVTPFITLISMWLLLYFLYTKKWFIRV
ncbi:MAG: DUF5009 domain-containing protein [Candidatus Hydrogenedentes bacterium]|nr:DUF5009 domain-containing protein [Candidatus Hydrogenedentota bacterium]